jgi:hypothetical protein
MEKRSVITLFSTLAAGILIILVLTYSDDIERFFGKTPINVMPKSNHEMIDNAIRDMNKSKFDPSIYATIYSQIEASYQSKLFSIVVKDQLENDLKQEYAKLVYKEFDNYLMGYNTDYNYVIKLLQNLNIIYPNPKITFYKNQFSCFNHFTKLLGSSIVNFINAGVVNYTDARYQSLKNEVVNMSGIDSRFQSSGQLQNIKSKYIDQLDRFNYQWATSSNS